MLWRLLFTNRLFHLPNKSLLQAVKFIKMPFYAVARGRTAGIYMTWPDCEAQVKGFPGSRYKKFDSIVSAQDFITTEGGSVSQPAKSSKSFAISKSHFGLPNQPGTSNLKRSFNTSAHNHTHGNIPKKKAKSKRTSSSDSNDSDDMNTIITKQLDDIENRVRSFEKGIDKIRKKNSKTIRTAIMIPHQTINGTNVKQTTNDFETDEDGYVQVYTDGACSANGRNGAKAGLGVFWGEGHPMNISEPVSGRATNNCGEIQAATRAIQMAKQRGLDKLAINTDSKFLINSVTKWMHGWKRKGWKLQSGEPVKNERDFKELDSIQDNIQIKWNYVEAHKGIHGNEKADQLAKAGAAMYNK